MNTKLTCLAICAALVLLLGYEAQITSAVVTCNPLQLSPCASAITSASTPTA
ncbi:Hypothetical predicted protein, partial [Olea europaea subsp. europaea]